MTCNNLFFLSSARHAFVLVRVYQINMVHFANVSEVVCGMKQGRQPLLLRLVRFQGWKKGSFVFCLRQLTTHEKEEKELCNRERARMTFDAVTLRHFNLNVELPDIQEDGSD